MNDMDELPEQSDCDLRLGSFIVPVQSQAVVILTFFVLSLFSEAFYGSWLPFILWAILGLLFLGRLWRRL